MCSKPPKIEDLESLDFPISLDKLRNMWKKLMIRTFTFIMVFLMVGIVQAQQPKNSEKETPKFPEHCMVDSDCVAAPVVNPRCNRFCEDDCAEDTPTCNVYYKLSGISVADCVHRAPCKAPNKIICKNKACIAE